MAENRKGKRFPGFDDKSFLRNEFKGTREFIEKALADGRLKRCASCKRPIGKAYNICGPCEEVLKMETMANGVRKAIEKNFY